MAGAKRIYFTFTSSYEVVAAAKEKAGRVKRKRNYVNI